MTYSSLGCYIIFTGFHHGIPPSLNSTLDIARPVPVKGNLDSLSAQSKNPFQNSQSQTFPSQTNQHNKDTFSQSAFYPSHQYANEFITASQSEMNTTSPAVLAHMLNQSQSTYQSGVLNNGSRNGISMEPTSLPGYQGMLHNNHQAAVHAGNSIVQQRMGNEFMYPQRDNFAPLEETMNDTISTISCKLMHVINTILVVLI